jgi:hypothetical protein
MARTHRPYVRNVKVKFFLEQAMKISRGDSSFTSALDRGGWSTPRPGLFTS